MLSSAGQNVASASASGSAGAASTSNAGGSVPAPLPISQDLRKCLVEVDALLAIHVAAWMKKRGKSLRPKLSDEQRKQLAECFELMDADGSGAIDADELGAAFKLLGLDVSKADITEMLAEVDEDGSGEVEYPEFIEIMTTTLSKLADKKEQEGAGGNQVPFALLATAYRRKRIMEGLISGDREVMVQVTAIAEQAARRAAKEALRNQRHGRSSRASGNGSCGSRCGSNRSSGNGSVASAEEAAEQRVAHVAHEAGMSPGLLRALQHVKSFHSSSFNAGRAQQGTGTTPNPASFFIGGTQPVDRGQRAGGAKEASCSSPSSSSNAAAGAGAGGTANLGAEIPGGLDDETGMLHAEDRDFLMQLLRRKTRKHLDALAAAAAGAAAPPAAPPSPRGQRNGSNACGPSACRPSGPASAASNQGSSSGLVCDGHEGLVGSKQKLTSQLIRRQLTQSVEMPKFVMSSSIKRGEGSSCSSPASQLGSQPHLSKSVGNSPAHAHPPPLSIAALEGPASRSFKSCCTTPTAAAGHTDVPTGTKKQANPLYRQAAAAIAAAASACSIDAAASAVAVGASSSPVRQGIRFKDCSIHEYSTATGKLANSSSTVSKQASMYPWHPGEPTELPRFNVLGDSAPSEVARALAAKPSNADDMLHSWCHSNNREQSPPGALKPSRSMSSGLDKLLSRKSAATTATRAVSRSLSGSPQRHKQQQQQQQQQQVIQVPPRFGGGM